MLASSSSLNVRLAAYYYTEKMQTHVYSLLENVTMRFVRRFGLFVSMNKLRLCFLPKLYTLISFSPFSFSCHLGRNEEEFSRFFRKIRAVFSLPTLNSALCEPLPVMINTRHIIL